MKARDVMTSSVISVEPNATVLKAARLMLLKRVSGLPVVTANGELVGIVTEGDFLRRAEAGTKKRRSLWHDILVGPGKLAEEYVHSHGRVVHEVMTPDPHTVTEDTPLEAIVDLMERHRIKRLPVVSEGRLVGIVSRNNLLRVFASTQPPKAETSDEAIRGHLLDELGRERWASLGAIDVTVRDGIVHLWGTITDERERSALVVAAENAPGAKGVRDHLAWIEIHSGVVIPSDEDGRDGTEAA